MRTMLAAAAMTTLGALPVFLLSAQAVLVREELHFSEPQLGLAVSVFFASAALASMFAGALVERLGRRHGTIIAGGLAAADTLLVALVADSYGILLALLVMGGLANAMLQMTANIALARSVNPGRQGLAFGVKQSAVPVAILLGGVAVPTVGVVVGWRWTFVAAAAAALVVMGAGLRIPRSSKSRAAPGADRDRPPRGALLVSFLAMTLASAAVNSLGAFLPAWAFRVGIDPGPAGLLLAAASALSVLTRVTTGLLADRRRGRNFPVVSTYIALGSVGMVLISFADVRTLVVGALVAFAIGWGWPGLFLFAVVRIGRDSPAAASGSVQAGAFAGGAAGPLLFGLVVAAAGYPVAWRAGAVVLVCAAVLLMVARRMFVSDLSRRPPRRPLDTLDPPQGTAVSRDH